MYFEKLVKSHYEAALALREYCLSRNLSDSLLERCAATLLRSISYGDGALWSDSLLVGGLVDEKSKLRQVLDPFPSLRSKIIYNKDFKSTLETQRLEINPCFQSALDFELVDLAKKRGSSKKISETDLMLIELRAAMEDFIHENVALDKFLAYVSQPIFSKGFDQNTTERYKYYRMGTILIDCISLAMLSEIHPFLAFNVLNNKLERERINNRYLTCKMEETFKYDEFKRYRSRFYMYLRDAADISLLELNDEDLSYISNHFNWCGLSNES